MLIIVLDIKALECSQAYSHQLLHLFEISATSNERTQNNQILHYCRTLDLDWLLLDILISLFIYLNKTGLCEGCFLSETRCRCEKNLLAQVCATLEE